MQTKVLDKTDKLILNLLSKNPELSQTQLSEQLHISQPAVSARMHKLKESGVLRLLAGTDIRKAQLFLAKIDAVTTDTEQVIRLFERCPLYLNSFLTSGKHNLTILLIGENIRSIMSCVDSHWRLDPLIKEMEFNLIITPTRDFIVPVRPVLEKKETTPCKTNCSRCALYENSRCLGCPSSLHYKGNIL